MSSPRAFLWRAVVSLATGSLMALVVLPVLAPDLFAVRSPPPYCFPTSLSGQVCIEWNQELGRYNVPPPGIPADAVRFAGQMYPPQGPLVSAGLVFAVASLASFLLLTVIGPALRIRGRPSG